MLRCRDAPRDGRRELERLLAERFPQQAPVRTGQRNRWAASDAPHALAAGTPMMAGLDAIMNAPTRTTPGSPRARAGARSTARRTGLVAVALLAVAVPVVALVVALSASDRVVEGTDARGDAVEATPASATDAAAATTPVPDAATVPSASAIDAGSRPEVDAAGPAIDGGPAIDPRKTGPRHGAGSRSGSSPIHEIVVPADEGTAGRRRGP